MKNRYLLMLLMALSTLILRGQNEKPNVLFITVDDMNGWGLMKHYPLSKSPYLDKLRAQSYNFTKAVCASPVCVPSRAALFSGLYPHRTGSYYNGGDPWVSPTPSGEITILEKTESLFECFKRNGYETFGRGKIFHAEVGKQREEAMFDNRPIYKGGFGPFGDKEHQVGGKGQFQTVQALPDSTFPDVKNADAAIEFLNKKHDKPFLCYVGYWRPHTPYTAPKRFFDMHDSTKIVMPLGYKADDLLDAAQMGRDLVDSLRSFGKGNQAERHATFKKMIYGYLATTSFADWSVGRVIEALDNSEFAKNTIVVVCSDNGYHMGEKERFQKGTLWELSAYSPLLIRLPNGRAFECPQTVNLIDIYPTLIELCKLDPPKHSLDGKSLRPIFETPSVKWQPSLMTYGAHYSSVSDGRYRYIRYPDGSEELYDHQTDPHEWTNIADKKKLKKVKMRLAKAIPTTWAKSLGGMTEKQKGA
jgi:arylsulfatase A-like enzyme